MGETGIGGGGGDSALIGNGSTSSHTVKTKHLRKHPTNHHHAKNENYNKYSEEEIEEIVEQRADDIVPVDSIYSMTYPSINHIHKGHDGSLFHLSDIAGHIALVINVASE